MENFFTTDYVSDAHFEQVAYIQSDTQKEMYGKRRQTNCLKYQMARRCLAGMFPTKFNVIDEIIRFSQSSSTKIAIFRCLKENS